MTMQKIPSQKQCQRLSEESISKFALDRFNEVKKSRKLSELASYHFVNRFLIKVHDSDEFEMVEKIIKDSKNGVFSLSVAEYEKHLRIALTKLPTVQSHVDVIMQIYGHFASYLDSYEKERIFSLIEKFKNEEISVGIMLSSINPIIFRIDNLFLTSQSYFLLYSEPDMKNIFK